MATTTHDLSSPLFEVRQTPSAGRAVFAKQRIPKDTHLHTSASPLLWVVYREYRREVCAECFAYNRGEHWKLRDTEGMGIAWCSHDCKQAWCQRWPSGPEDATSLAVDAWAAVESLVCKASTWNNGDWDVAMLDSASKKPSEEETLQAWRDAEHIASAIRTARVAGNRWHRRVMRSIMAEPPAPDILTYLLSAVLSSSGSPKDWQRLLDLAESPTPYSSRPQLNQHILAYHQLLAVLPVALLGHVTAETCLAASDRDAHNSFGLRSLDDDGSEMFGYGVWPSASYWNHSCRPNVRKQRLRRGWSFETSEVVEEGEELCITYLGGDERHLNLHERRERLEETWEFTCKCNRCAEEDKT